MVFAFGCLLCVCSGGFLRDFSVASKYGSGWGNIIAF